MLLVEAHRRANELELNVHLSQINADLEIEKMCNDELNRQRKATQGQFWWAAPIEEMNNGTQEELKLALEELKKSVILQAKNQLVHQAPALAANPPLLLHPPPCPPPRPPSFAGGSSSNKPPLVHPMMMPHQGGFNNLVDSCNPL